ncbi:AAA family ATPase [Candidatus Venteria ishoeyi]|uniref:ATPase family associated with various cellular activities (AAA) n=1 Tax=Candidatus Venteria ishoeyi TaxID=1899563 RepID=A0A1H6FGY7_9GAMM|nr:MoxR family ATPase [Candidatus Venteria ishoeyi]MDM8546608.1 MoxR family ATPase [Candidatus Venteria ishoeyi]SEH08923.1 ATPase family associated with various cellular activities (AAA) [Candidatus Venteria ishoeyi]
MSTQDALNQLKTSIQNRIVGQEALVLRLLITLLADGHLLVEGAPGLAKTTAIKTLAGGLEGNFHRVQFTPDLLPADLTGTEIYRPQDGSFVFQQGPLFHNLVLADEINRAPAKVQSALLEAMGERQITIGKETWGLPRLFLVMATQNPIEQEGTYPLPEAQLDRFLMKVLIDYPSPDTEQTILSLARQEARENCAEEPITTTQTHETETEVLSQDILFSARREVLDMHLDPALETYMIHLIAATRNPQAYHPELSRYLEFGGSPRATIALERCARAHAWLHGQDYVSPGDIQSIAHDVLRHRLILSFAAEAEGKTADHVIDELLNTVPVP